MNTTAKKLIGIILCLALVLSFGTVFASADSLSGKGTESEPYLITSTKDLNTLSQLVNGKNDFSGKYISLEADITADASFKPVGSKSAPFSGRFNGNGHKISGFDLDCAYASLFAYTKNAVIENVSVSGTFFATDYAGSIVAYAENTTISDCVGGASVYADDYAGGIAGYISGGSISNCMTLSTATVGGYEENCGGIAGSAKAEIINCSNNAYVRGNMNAGGIAGTLDGTILSSSNNATVSASDNNAGGIAGFAKGTIKSCMNTGDITTNGAVSGKIGGIAGIGSDLSIAECVSTGTVTATGEYAGGIAGYLTAGSITDCASAGNVTAITNFAGGIFGSTSKTAVERCVFVATASAPASGAIGAISGGTVNNCYYDSAKSSKAFASAVSASGATGVSASALTSESTFKGWDFTSTWEISERHSDQHPLPVSLDFHTFTELQYYPATCTENGLSINLCTVCNKRTETVISATGHSFVIVSQKVPSCSVAGYKDTVCENCNEAKSESLDAIGHKDENADKTCDICKADITTPDTDSEKSIFEKIADFFKGILDWFRSLFK